MRTHPSVPRAATHGPPVRSRCSFLYPRFRDTSLALRGFILKISLSLHRGIYGGKRMRAFIASVAGMFMSAGLVQAADNAVDYAKDVKPILAKNCYSCHGGGKAKGKLRVDSLASMIKGGGSGPSVVPGKSKDSPLIHSLTGDGDIKRMPPRGGLSKNDIDTLKKWVDAGAKAPDEKADVAAAPPPTNRGSAAAEAARPCAARCNAGKPKRKRTSRRRTTTRKRPKRRTTTIRRKTAARRKKRRTTTDS